MSAVPGGQGTLLERLLALARDGYDQEEARIAGGRALFDHLACLGAGRGVVPAGVGDAGAAAAQDRDDVHWPSLSHPGAAIWTVLLQLQAEGSTLWRAAHLGYEVTTRLARALGGEHRRYWHATSTAGTVGAASAAAEAMGSDPVDAAAHAVSLVAGSIVPILERTGTRLLHRDHAADTGLRCARAATALGAARDCLEHPRGMFAAMGGSPDALLEVAPSSALAEVSFRRHATSGFSQALVEAAAEIAPLKSPQPVVIEAPPETIALAAIAEPQDAEQAWWSCQHAVAVTLLGLDLEDACLVQDAAVVEQRRSMEVRVGSISRVSVGAATAARARADRLSDEQLVRKWLLLNPEVAPPTDLLTDA